MNLTPEALFGLTGKIAVVTGATGRLGRVMARTLATAGAQVWLVGRDSSRLDELAAELLADGLSAVAARCDVTDPDDVQALGVALSVGPGRVDVLVHNAHVGRGGTLATARTEDFAQAADLALAAFQRLLAATRDLLVRAAADSSPAVITVSSMYGLVSPRPSLYASPEQVNPPYYGAVKAGLLQLTRYAAVELAPQGVRVNAITPGAFPGGGDPEFLKALGEHSPLGRVGSPEEIATALLFLASPRSSYTTGANVVVDGGWTAW
ncbi:NAD(P)-dependent dehydrogenase (short-subunit alcohol dehydrogenase family) [Hamadaea flava]|uniref:SDR family NAD(P)-dependent oxidoreductase n=1 Tax=Hamadaea flava TaxID=1742688 RepID=A0ABV8LWS4_9ACTN|nr:SDR family oxidoreductase [Hamadaea flava]MCP2324555.1 NAD(P)-dependent dehydrogenase (short-subunit alcohol dehydrogenase family) [Hamadaea flava]